MNVFIVFSSMCFHLFSSDFHLVNLAMVFDLLLDSNVDSGFPHLGPELLHRRVGRLDKRQLFLESCDGRLECGFEGPEILKLCR